MKSSNFLLLLILFLCAGILVFSYKTYSDMNAIKEQVLETRQKTDSLMIATAKIAKSTRTIAAKKQPRTFWDELFSSLEESSKEAAAAEKARAAKAKVTVSAKYRIEDRYVVGSVELPDYLGSEDGQITVNVEVNNFGSVKKTSVAEGTTITNQEVIDAARRAALQTSFNSNYDAPETVTGTITYIFKKK